MSVTVNYQPAGRTLAKFHQSRARVRCVIGPIGSAKTTASIVELLKQIDSMPPGPDGVRRSRWAVIRNSAVDLRSSTIKDWQEIVPPQLGSISLQPPINHQINYQQPDGTRVSAEVLFLGFDHDQDVKKLRGLQLTGVWADEGKELPKSIIDMALGRCGRYPARRMVNDYWYGMIVSSNAPARDEWLAKMYFARPPTWEFFIQPGGVVKVAGKWVLNERAENLENLPVSYYLDQLHGKREDWIRANLANEFVFVANGRPVHPDFSERLHVAESILSATPGVPLRIGVDFGRTPAAVIAQRELSGQWRVIDELVTHNTSVLTFGKALRKKLNEEYDGFEIEGWGDPAGTSDSQTRDENCFDILAGEGIDLLPAPSNDFNLRCAATDSVLQRIIEGEPAILISPKCENLILGLAGGYKFRRVMLAGTDRYADKPDKTPSSHVSEALQYVLLGSGEGEPTFGTGWGEEFAAIERELDGGRWRPNPATFN